MSSTTLVPAATSATSSPSSLAASKAFSAGNNLKVVGILLAVISGTLIGSSFVFKKKGLLRSQADGVAGEGVAYLKSPLWWSGMIMMILGELCNFAAYAFVEAIVVTPLGALSVVISAVLSSFFLKEKLTFFGWLGCGLCVLGSIIIALNGPESPSVGQIKEFEKLFVAPGFLVWASLLILASFAIIIFVVPKYGKKSMLWYILVCSMIGGISVSVTSGLGAAIVTTAYGDSQFKHWFIYFLIGFIAVTLVTEVYYLNCALALFNTAMVTPTYYVIFTFFSIITTVVLFQGLHAPVRQILTLVLGFLVICFGIIILQMSKIDPLTLGNRLDRRSTLLLQAARAKTESMEEKSVLSAEDPGIDTLRGSFGAVGSIIRARSARRLSQASSTFRVGRISSTQNGATTSRANGDSSWSLASSQLPQPVSFGTASGELDPLSGMKRHQLYDAPMPSRGGGGSRGSVEMHPTTSSSVLGSPSIMSKRTTIKFGDEDVVHQYDRPGTGDRMTEHRRAVLGSPRGQDGYPPLPTVSPSRTEGLPLGGMSYQRGMWNRSADDLSPVEETGSVRRVLEPGNGTGISADGGTAEGDESSNESSGSQTLLMDSRFGIERNAQNAPPPAIRSASSPAGALGLLGVVSSSAAGGSRNVGIGTAAERRLRAGSTQSATMPTTRPGSGGRKRRGTDAGRGDARTTLTGFQPPHQLLTGAAGVSHDFPVLEGPGRIGGDEYEREILWGSDVESERGRRTEDPNVRPKMTSASAKRYPRRSGGEDDREEIESLWRRSGMDESGENKSEDSPVSPSLLGGIRLVTTEQKGRF